jgi:hypothetical protein
VIHGLGFDGGDYSYYATRTFQTYAGTQNFSSPGEYYHWNPSGLRHGLQFNSEGGGRISDLNISGFGGIALLPVSRTGISGNTTVKTTVRDITCSWNFTGLFSSGATGNPVGSGTNAILPNWINNYVPGGLDPEFMTYSGLNLNQNTVGLCASAGNCAYVNCEISLNLYGQLDSYGNNDHHGVINSILYTHNINDAVYIKGCSFGEEFINCTFADNVNGTVTLDACQAWRLITAASHRSSLPTSKPM